MLVHSDETQYKPRIIRLETTEEYYHLVRILDNYAYDYENDPKHDTTCATARILYKLLLET